MPAVLTDAGVGKIPAYKKEKWNVEKVNSFEKRVSEEVSVSEFLNGVPKNDKPHKCSPARVPECISGR